MHSIAREEIEKHLHNAEGYVLLTCAKPDSKGDMHVEMSYDGDPDLLLYMLDGAKMRLDEECSVN